MIGWLDPYLVDWLDLLIRWLHVVAAIVWIGTSFYFVALDSHLLPPRDRRDRDEGVGGESWEIHGGGFYRVQKYGVAPETLPEPLHWFKWEAYTTWISGFALLVVLYYADADKYLVDPSVADIDAQTAVALSLGLLVVAWFVYDGLCRLLGRHELLLAAALIAFVTASAYVVSELFSARALPIQVGAMLGTMMVGNVLFVIIPGHWEVVRAKQEGRDPDPAHGIKGKQRSVHNNYLTLPVVLAMLGPHFPFAFARDDGWLVLVALMLVGAWIRLFFNLRHRGRTVWAIPVTAALAVVVIAIAIRPEDDANAETSAAVPFAQVAAIVEQRCATCHSAMPTDSSFSAAPLGVELDTPAQIKARADAIEELAVRTRVMPLGNATGMTDAERELLGRWIEQGAKVEP
ncbi:MAG TPA: urate hydroxylase PuuD [Gaiellaceae bacterium]|nr:urate hydroxylase PuuD [Gaiellaceae bacterium]